jgi:hypothetical protein
MVILKNEWNIPEMNGTHRKNLKQLANYLWSLPDNYNHFDMRDYFARHRPKDGFLARMTFSAGEASGLDVTTCNTVACALGHSFAAGLPYNNESFWGNYCGNVFGFSLYSRIYDWCFSSAWFGIDNTPKGAAKRIYYLLENETVPEEFRYPGVIFVKIYQNQSPIDINDADLFSEIGKLLD